MERRCKLADINRYMPQAALGLGTYSVLVFLAFAYSDRLWPVQWTGGSAGGSGWSSVRNLEAAAIAQAGQYDVCVSLMHKSWTQTYYKGSVTFSFV